MMWMVRAGEGGYLVSAFARGFVAIGWEELGDLTPLTSSEAVRDHYLAKYGPDRPGRVASATAIIFKFRSTMKVDDDVITYDPESREYLVGVVTSTYRYSPGTVPDSPHVRQVKWNGRVSRDVLSSTSRNSLGSAIALFSVGEDIATELQRSLDQANQPTSITPTASEPTALDDIAEDAISRAHELIKDRILRLAAEDAELLTAAILRAMGYKSRVSPRGPDRGVDVQASPDGLGLETPRIKAEVKHRSGTQIGSADVRSFLGGLREGDRGMYVSTGGFSKDARYEADRSVIPVTLVDLDLLPPWSSNTTTNSILRVACYCRSFTCIGRPSELVVIDHRLAVSFSR